MTFCDKGCCFILVCMNEIVDNQIRLLSEITSVIVIEIDKYLNVEMTLYESGREFFYTGIFVIFTAVVG